MDNNIMHYAAIYARYKDQLEQVLPETIEELTKTIQREFLNIPYPVVFVDEELNDIEEIIKILKETGTLRISSLHNNSPIFPPDINLAFRAWHDYIHIEYNFPLNYEGELYTYLYQAQGLSRQAKLVLFSEIVLQAAFYTVNGYFPETQKIIINY